MASKWTQIITPKIENIAASEAKQVVAPLQEEIKNSTDGLSKGVKDELDKGVKDSDIGKKIGKQVKDGINKGAKVALAGFAAAGAVGFKLAQGAAEDEKAAASLANQLKNVGYRAKDIQQVNKVIDEFGKKFGIADDIMRPAIATLARAGTPIGKLGSQMEIVANIAAGSGQPIDSIAEALAKVELTGRVKSLARFGVDVQEIDKTSKQYVETIKAQTKATVDQAKEDFKAGKISKQQLDLITAKAKASVDEAKAQAKSNALNEATQQLNQKYSNAAIKAAQTTEGRLAIFRVSLAEAGESIGYAILPALNSLAVTLNTKVIPAIEGAIGWAEENQGAVKLIAGSIAALGAAFILAAGAIKVYNGIMAVVKVVSAVATAAQWALNVAMAANPIGLIIIAIVALVAAIVIAYKKSETFRNIVNAVWAAIKATVTTVINAVIAYFKLYIQAYVLIWNTVKTVTIAVINFLKNIFKAYIGVYIFMWNAIKTKATGALNFLKSIPGKVKGVFAGAASWLKDAGKNIIKGLVDGIKSAASLPKEALGGVLGGMRNMLPFSPAKEGPFSGRGWTKYSGQELIKGLQLGIDTQQPKAAKTMSNTMQALKTSSTPPQAAGVSGGGRGVGNFTQIIQTPAPQSIGDIQRAARRGALLGGSI